MPMWPTGLGVGNAARLVRIRGRSGGKGTFAVLCGGSIVPGWSRSAGRSGVTTVGAAAFNDAVFDVAEFGAATFEVVGTIAIGGPSVVAVAGAELSWAGTNDVVAGAAGVGAGGAAELGGIKVVSASAGTTGSGSTLTTSGVQDGFLPAIAHSDGSVAVFGSSGVAGAT
jgi:hypothetical protein